MKLNFRKIKYYFIKLKYLQIVAELRDEGSEDMMPFKEYLLKCIRNESKNK